MGVKTHYLSHISDVLQRWCRAVCSPLALRVHACVSDIAAVTCIHHPAALHTIPWNPGPYVLSPACLLRCCFDKHVEWLVRERRGPLNTPELQTLWIDPG